MFRVVAPLLAVLLPGVSEAQDALQRGEQLLARGQYAEAEAALREAVASDPGSARAHGNLALALLALERAEDAVAAAARAAALSPEAPEARFIHGRALLAAGRPLEAARELAVVVEGAPAQPAPLEALARAYTLSADDRAAAAWERLVALRPLVPRHRIHLAEVLWASGQAARGNRVAEDALRELGPSAPLHARYGLALFDQERFIDAARELQRARDLGTTDLETLSRLAHARARAGEAQAAIEAFRAAIERHPQAHSLHEDLGRLLLSIGRPEEARASLQEAVRRQPDRASGHVELGRAWETAGDLASAEKAYRQAVALAPQLASARYMLGRLLARRGQAEESRRELETYRKLYDRASRHVEETSARGAELAQAWAELRRGDAAAALARFEAVPESAESLVGRGEALSSLGRHGEAVRVLERARQLDPQSPRIASLLASAQARVGKARP